jgi:hypothetical protein
MYYSSQAMVVARRAREAPCGGQGENGWDLGKPAQYARLRLSNLLSCQIVLAKRKGCGVSVEAVGAAAATDGAEIFASCRGVGGWPSI